MNLSILNAHERDKYGRFEEEPHIYYYKEKQMKKSVTGLVHDWFPQFDADKTATSLSKKYFDNESSKYYQMTKDDILQLWDRNREDACTKGTHLHKSIELFYNQLDVNNDTLEYNNHFKNFVCDHPHLTAFRTEWEVFYEELQLAGSIDMIFRSKDGTFSIYDWKRSKKIEKSNSFEFGKDELDHLPNSNFWHYSLQLNCYKRILEVKYNFTVKDMFLIVMHPDNKNYIKYECPNLQQEVSVMFDHLD